MLIRSAKDMHQSKSTIIVVTMLIAIIGCGYWFLSKNDPVSESSSNQDSNLEQTDEPSQKLTLWQLMQDFLIASWASERDPYVDSFFVEGSDGSDGNKDFVEILEDGSCHFSLHEFKHEGKVVFDRSYAGFYTEFLHQGKKYIFIFSPDDETSELEEDKRLAVAFVGHDSKPRYRETDYIGYFLRKTAQ